MSLAATIFASLPLYRHVGWLEVGALIGVAICTWWLAWRLARQVGHEPAVAEDPATSTLVDSQLPSLLRNILPVWMRHLTQVKTQAESAVGSMASSFSSMLNGLEKAGLKGVSHISSTTRDAPPAMSLLTLCERELTPVMPFMEKIIDSKDELLKGVHELQAATLELKDMAHDVSLIAAHTNILAINAAIEAARSGESGRGFAVIAGEIRKLSQLSAETGKNISVRMVEVTSIMQQTLEKATLSSEHDKKIVSLTGQVLQDVLSHVRALGAEAEAMRQQGNVIRGDVEQLLVNLQYQDRISQMLSVIHDNIERLESTVTLDQEPIPSPEQWLQQLESRYPMEDMHAPNPQRAGSLSGGLSPGKTPSPNPNTEFF